MAILLVMALSWRCALYATSLQDEATHLETPENQDITVSIVTCYPGPEIYELCGHAAVRVRGEGIDSVWNYGIFDFNQPNFIYRFVKGETDYRGAGYPFRWFLPEYMERGSKVVEQDLNLTPEQSRRMLQLLRESVLPENAVYRYNYVKDNCATRILNLVDSASGEKIIYPDSVRYGSFRNEMRAYHKGYPWYQFGIDLALGSGLDYPISSREEMFVPVEMERNLNSAHFHDGRPVIKETRVLNEGVGSAVLPPTPWYTGPIFWSWMLALLTFAIVAWQIIQKRLLRVYYALWFTILGVAGCLIAFLVFISVHEAADSNVLILWLNPLQFLFTIGVIFRRLRPLAVAMAYYNLIVVGIFLLVSPFIIQSFNPAFYPLMAATFALGFGYAIIGNKSSYKRR